MARWIGVLLSGRGSNFEALADSVAAGRIPGAEIAVVVSNREGAPGIEKAKERKIATRVIPSKGLEREAYDRQVVAGFSARKRDVAVAGGSESAAWHACCVSCAKSKPSYSCLRVASS